LGTIRVELGSNGCESTFTNLPFGDGLTTVLNGCADETEHHFTGKERDTESGNDYFGARYYASSMGRWLSPDPKQPDMKFLANPQKWNKYAYVLNNPLAYFDPDGEQEFKVTIRAFIPDKNFKYPAGVGPTWKGDGRSFSKASNASSRAQVTFTIETDPSKSAKPLVGTPSSSTSGSAVDLYGAKTLTGNSNVQTSVNINGRTSDGTSVVSLSVNASDPLVPGAPSTGGTFTFNVAPDGSSVSMNGAFSVYPAYEVYVQDTSTGAQGTLLQYTPEGTNANSPGALIGGDTMTVQSTTTLPDKPAQQCPSGQSCSQ
jgi:RHS repeat-associated protein